MKWSSVLLNCFYGETLKKQGNPLLIINSKYSNKEIAKHPNISYSN